MFIHDFHAAQLGDARCTQRLVRMAEDISCRPAAALPAIFNTDASLEAAYRFANRARTSMEGILAPHADATVKRARSHGRVLVIHDTTEFEFKDYGFERQNLSQLSTNRQGFYDHVSLAVSANGDRELLGVMSHIPYVHRSQVDDQGAVYWEERGGLYENEHERWLDAVHICEDAFGDDEGTVRIHIADREGDSFDLLHCLQQRETGFVVRCAQRHRKVLQQNDEVATLESVLERAHGGAETRSILVPDEPLTPSKKKKSATPKATAARRRAEVSVRWSEVTLAPSAHDLQRSKLDEVPLVYVSVVEVTERDPPTGRKPATWVLYHSETIGSEEDAWQVVDYYRARWTIEEYFKVLKTGMAYETRQLTTAHGLLNLLAVCAVVACDILCLRDFDRHHPEMPADDRFDADVVEFARQRYPKLVKSDVPTMAELLAVVAREGGHIKQNGPPGWQVLYRGYAAILNAVRVIRDLGIDLALVKPAGRA